MSIIGITMGCPAGIGPEIILKYFNERKFSSSLHPVVLGDKRVLEMCADRLALPKPDLVEWQPGHVVPKKGIPILELSSLSASDVVWGTPNHTTAEAMAVFIKTAAQLTLKGELDGIATCPISKASLNAAGYNYPGHTEMLGELTKSDGYVMMMAGSTLRVTLVTIHCGLKDVVNKLSTEGILFLIRATHLSLKRDFGISNAKIGVAGLNPHAGEDGLFGNEEEEIIKPAILEAINSGINVEGPFPPDTVFYKASSGKYDAVVCMYHDQGLIPFKLLHFEDGVNVTLGLPIVRTSVDHGTAYDIAGKGIASDKSLFEAIQLAATISDNRKMYDLGIGEGLI